MKNLLVVFIVSLWMGSASAENVLGPFPALGSAEEIQDISVLLDYQNQRSPEQCKLAQAEANASLESFYGKLLSTAEIRQVKKYVSLLTVKTGIEILYYKRIFNRPRPYISHPEIKPCIDLESSKAYPSGHATLARVYARVLSEAFPERKIQFMKHSEEIAQNRVIGGVHHPSDVEAGKVLGDALADDYLSDHDIRSEF